MERSLRLLLPLTAVVTLGACSLLNAPGNEVPGSGGGPAGCDCTGVADDCNTGVCHGATCVAEPKSNGTKCDDGDFCTDDDACHAGKCIGGNPHVCKDKDACHPGVCDKQSQKCTTSVSPDNSPCDDGNPCDNKGACMSGTCQPGMTKCHDPPFTTTCGTGYCQQGVGCKTQPMNQGASCTEGIAPECATGACDSGACNPTPIMGTDGDACASGKYCLIGTSCQQGVCTGGAKRTCTPPDPCSTADCDEVDNVCVVKSRAEGAACDDGDGCTTGTTCHGGKCKNPAHTVTNCLGGDKCCPAGCTADTDSDCLYWATGVQQNVPVTALAGWTLCFLDPYNGTTTTTDSIPTSCAGGSVLMGCGQYDLMTNTVSVLQIAAMGAYADVFFNCDVDPTCVNQANGVGFYYSDNWSWGFAPGGAPVNRNACDVGDNDATSPLRMCVHTDTPPNLDEGYRCGTEALFDNSYARVAYSSPFPPP